MSVDVDDAVVEALYEYGCTTMNGVLKHVRKRIRNVDERAVRQIFQELQSKQQEIFGA